MEKLGINTHTCEGWMVQVYGRDRRLLWVLEPFHGWIFLFGCGLGLLLAIVWFNLASYSPTVEAAEPTTETPFLQLD